MRRVVRDTTPHCESCGWTGRTTTAALAEYALQRHSCERHRRRAERAARAQAREAAIDRTPQPCHHPRASHQHGTTACYAHDRCRCWPCTRARSEYDRQRLRQSAYGRWSPHMDAEPVRQHLLELRAAGIGYAKAAQIAGVSAHAAGAILYGRRRDDGTRRPPPRRVSRRVGEALLSVTPDPSHLSPGRYIDGTGSRRRLQALVAVGWSLNRLAQQLGTTLQSVQSFVAGDALVTVARARRIAALYDRLWDVEPPQATKYERASVTRARNHARRMGWVPPLAWDEESIDDPTAAPSVGGPDEARRDRVVHVEDIEWLMSHDMHTAQTLADRLGVSRSTIQTALTRAGRDDLLAVLARNVAVRRAA